jgi:hypothetical protein
MSYKYYIVNNESVSIRHGGGPANSHFTISGAPFVESNSDNVQIFQMLKDSYFSMITSTDSFVEFYIVAINDTMSNHENKQHILDYFNSSDISHIDGLKQKHSIITIMQFTGRISEHIKNDSLMLPSDKNYNSIYKVNNIKNCLNNIKLSFMLNDIVENKDNKIKKSKYVSNPCFEIEQHILEHILKND